MCSHSSVQGYAHSCRILPEAAGATDAMAEALWRVVDNIVDSIDDTLSTSDAEALAAPTEKIHRLRELHASCLPQERQLQQECRSAMCFTRGC